MQLVSVCVPGHWVGNEPVTKGGKWKCWCEEWDRRVADDLWVNRLWDDGDLHLFKFVGKSKKWLVVVLVTYTVHLFFDHILCIFPKFLGNFTYLCILFLIFFFFFNDLLYKDLQWWKICDIWELTRLAGQLTIDINQREGRVNFHWLLLLHSSSVIILYPINVKSWNNII